MLKEEFEKLVGRSVTLDQYKAIEVLYMNTPLNKEDFAKKIKSFLKSIPVEENKVNHIRTMCLHNQYGENITPNGAYYMTCKVRVIKTDVKRGKIIVEKIPNTFEYSPSFDINDWDSHIEIKG